MLVGHGLRRGAQSGNGSPLAHETIGKLLCHTHVVQSAKSQIAARSVTHVVHDDLQLTCQVDNSVEELNKLVIFVSNDIMILEKENFWVQIQS
jgi:hypothetical protein